MRLILKEEVDNLGNAGDIVDVKPGYGRNYLIPRGKAVMATDGALRQAEALRKEAERRAELTVEAAAELAGKLEATAVTIPVSTGEDDRIHGSVTTIQIAEALAELGFEIDRRKITLEKDVKTLGEYSATVELLGELKPTIKVWVVKEE